MAACFAVVCLMLLWLRLRPDVLPSDTVRASAGRPASSKDELASLSIPRPNPVLLPAAGTPLSTVARTIEQAASSGEKNAACRLAQDIRRCNNIRSVLDAADVFATLPHPQGQEALFPRQLLQQAEDDAAFCADVSRKLLARGYEFQARAADSGSREFERWLVLAPDLDQQNFLADLKGWEDYKKRAQRYIKRALSDRDGDDFQLLLALHAPADFRSIRPPYRADDDATFLALIRVASEYGIQVPTQMSLSAQRLSRTLSLEEKKSVDRRASEISGAWKWPSRQKLVDERLAGYQRDAFCR